VFIILRCGIHQIVIWESRHCENQSKVEFQSEDNPQSRIDWVNSIWSCWRETVCLSLIVCFTFLAPIRPNTFHRDFLRTLYSRIYCHFWNDWPKAWSSNRERYLRIGEIWQNDWRCVLNFHRDRSEFQCFIMTFSETPNVSHIFDNHGNFVSYSMWWILSAVITEQRSANGPNTKVRSIISKLTVTHRSDAQNGKWEELTVW
jgi:hypothetical protein